MRVSDLDVIRELKEQRKLERAAQKRQKIPQTKEDGTSDSGWVWDTDIVREAKERRRQEREALREQDKLNRELTKKARVSVARKIALFDAKTLAQKEAAMLLDCVIDQWQRGKLIADV